MLYMGTSGGPQIGSPPRNSLWHAFAKACYDFVPRFADTLYQNSY